MAENVFTSQIPTHGTTDIGVKKLNLVALRNTINNIAILLNNKDAGNYPLVEFICGQRYFPDPALGSATSKLPIERQVFRKVINFGALLDTAAKTSAHGITFAAGSPYSFTRIYATATDHTNGVALPIPYASPVDADNIEINVTGANVVITTGSNRTVFTTCFVVLEWIVN